MTDSTQKTAVFLGILFISVLTVFAWAFVVFQNRPNPVQYPQFVMWDSVHLALSNDGVHETAGPAMADSNGLIRTGAYLLSRFGHSYAILTSVQVPFLVILILSVGALAWRYGGLFAVLPAALFTSLSPITIGLSQQLDDFLPIQAMVAFCLALLAWSEKENRAWLSTLCIPSLCMLPWISLIPTNGLLGMAVFFVGALAILVFPVEEKRSSFTWRFIGLFLAFYFAGWVYYSRFSFHYFQYIQSEAAHLPQYPSIIENPAGLLGYPVAWFLLLAGPVLALASFAAMALFAYKKKFRVIVPTMCWLFIPMIALSILEKRNAYYLFSALPATYVLAGLCISKIRPRILAICLALIMIFILSYERLDDHFHPRNMKPIGESMGFQTPLVKTYYSPLSPQIPEEKIRDSLIEKCEGHGFQFLFVHPFDMDWKAVFYIWTARPDLFVNEENRAIQPKKGACRLAVIPEGIQNPHDLDQILKHYKSRVDENWPGNELMDANYKKSQQLIKHYEYHSMHNNMALFLPKSEI